MGGTKRNKRNADALEADAEGASDGEASGGGKRVKVVDEKKTKKAEEAKQPVVCGICQEEAKFVGVLGHWVGKQKPGCGHDFCFACIREWSRRCNRCPMCRQEFTRLKRQSAAGKVVKEYRIRKIEFEDSSESEDYDSDDDGAPPCLPQWDEEWKVCYVCGCCDNRPQLFPCTAGGCDRLQHTYCVVPMLPDDTPRENFKCTECDPKNGQGTTASTAPTASDSPPPAPAAPAPTTPPAPPPSHHDPPAAAPPAAAPLHPPSSKASNPVIAAQEASAAASPTTPDADEEVPSRGHTRAAPTPMSLNDRIDEFTAGAAGARPRGRVPPDSRLLRQQPPPPRGRAAIITHAETTTASIAAATSTRDPRAGAAARQEILKKFKQRLAQRNKTLASIAHVLGQSRRDAFIELAKLGFDYTDTVRLLAWFQKGWITDATLGAAAGGPQHPPRQAQHASGRGSTAAPRTCPVCSEAFPPGASEEEMSAHVNAHFGPDGGGGGGARSRAPPPPPAPASPPRPPPPPRPREAAAKCPVCGAAFAPGTSQVQMHEHVNSHF